MPEFDSAGHFSLRRAIATSVSVPKFDSQSVTHRQIVMAGSDAIGSQMTGSRHAFRRRVRSVNHREHRDSQRDTEKILLSTPAAAKWRGADSGCPIGMISFSVNLCVLCVLCGESTWSKQTIYRTGIRLTTRPSGTKRPNRDTGYNQLTERMNAVADSSIPQLNV